MSGSVVSEVVWLEVLSRDDFMCLRCNKTEDLQPAHYLARSLSGGDNADNIMTLCAYCHTGLHSGRYTVEKIKGHFFFGGPPLEGENSSPNSI